MEGVFEYFINVMVDQRKTMAVVGKQLLIVYEQLLPIIVVVSDL